MIFVYNPTCEMAVQKDTVNYYAPPKLQEFEQKLAPLMMFLAGKDDAVVAQRPSDDIIAFWQTRGLEPCQFIDRDEARRRIASGEHLKPWGMSREVLYRFCGKDAANSFTDSHRKLFSRLSSVELDHTARSLIRSEADKELFNTDEAPIVISKAEDLRNFIEADSRKAIKTLWSASGRGVSLVTCESFKQAAIDRFSASINKDGAVVGEPLLDRVTDFAMLFEIKKGCKAKYVGKNFYVSDATGRFGKELIGIDPIAPLTADGKLPADWETRASLLLADAMDKLQWNTLYEGPVGVDSMIYRKADGSLGIRLCIEANLRHSMGNINMRISQLLGSCAAEWSILSADEKCDFYLCNGVGGHFL